MPSPLLSAIEAVYLLVSALLDAQAALKSSIVALAHADATRIAFAACARALNFDVAGWNVWYR